nr:hypothetical protein [Tanacetum cinerariifolium]
MALTFADTHNMIAHLTKSYASEGFAQILDFLNASVINYALTINPTIYVSCIKQFWSSVLVKKMNDVFRLQALIDRKKVIITEDKVCQALRLDDAKRKGFFGANTPLVEGILVQHQAADDVDDVVVDDVIADDVTDVVAHATAEPTLSLSTPTTCGGGSFLDGRRVENLDQDKIAQALEITKLKQRVKRLEKGNKVKVSGLKRLRKEVVAEVDTAKDAKVEKNADVQGRQEESHAQAYHIDLEHVEKFLSMHDDEPKPAELKEMIEVVTSAKQMIEVITAAATTNTAAPSAAIRRKGVVIRDPEETATPSTKQDEAYARELEVELNKNIKWDDVIKQIGFFKGMSYDDIRPIFEKYFNSNVAFLEKSEKELEEEASMALKRKGEISKEKAVKKQKLGEEVEELKKHLQIVTNDDEDVYTEATPLALKMLNNVRLEVEEESEVSLELLRFLLDNADDSRLRLPEQSVAVDEKMMKYY